MTNEIKKEYFVAIHFKVEFNNVMENKEFEIVKYPKIKHIKMFVNKIQSISDHIHNDYEFLILLNGNCSAKIGPNVYELKEGDLYFINSGEVHSFHATVPTNAGEPNHYSNSISHPTFLFVQVSNHFLREYFPQIRTTIFKSANLREILTKEEISRVVNSLFKASIDYFAGKDFYTLDVISQIAIGVSLMYKKLPHEIIDENEKMKLKRRNDRLSRIISYIDANFDTQIRLDDLASMENLSVTHFSHLFSSSFGVTFQEFINMKRLEQCLRLMANNEKTLLEISFEAGFSDPKYMNKAFLKYYGCTPKQYRNEFVPLDKKYEVPDGKTETIFSDSASLKYLEDYKTNKLDSLLS